MTSVESSRPRALRSVSRPGDRAVRFRGVLRVIRLDVAVRVPRIGVLVAHPAVEQLHESHAVLDQPARHQALPAERLRDRVVEPVQLPRRLRLLVDVERLGRAPLHAIRQLVRRDARREIGVAGILLHVELVQLRQQIEPRALLFGAHAGRRLQVDDRIAGRAKQRPLIRGRNEARAPVVDAAERAAARVVNHDERRAGSRSPTRARR